MGRKAEKQIDETEIVLGKRYRDTISGWEGTAVSRHEYLHGCLRYGIEDLNKDGEPVDYCFDAPRLVPVEEAPKPEEKVEVVSARTGGPHDRRTPPSR
jgi:hypothetical protein